MATRTDPLSPAAFGIDAVGVLTRRVSPGQSLIREVKVSLARVRFGEDVAPKSDPRRQSPPAPSQAGRSTPGPNDLPGRVCYIVASQKGLTMRRAFLPRL